MRAVSMRWRKYEHDASIFLGTMNSWFSGPTNNFTVAGPASLEEEFTELAEEALFSPNLPLYILNPVTKRMTSISTYTQEEKRASLSQL